MCRQGVKNALERLEDRELLRLSRQGNTAAFAVLHARHIGAVRLTAQRVLGSNAAADDVAQETFVQLWRLGDRYVPERGSLRTWLLVLVRSRALDLMRRERVRSRAAERAVEGASETATVFAEEEFLRREQSRHLVAGLRELPPDQGRVLALLYLAGRTQAEVATALDVPLGTVKGRTRLGLAKLRRGLHGRQVA